MIIKLRGQTPQLLTKIDMLQRQAKVTQKRNPVLCNTTRSIECPTSGVAQRTMREAAPHARGVTKARQL
jgi:hypothetical protein